MTSGTIKISVFQMVGVWRGESSEFERYLRDRKTRCNYHKSTEVFQRFLNSIFGCIQWMLRHSLRKGKDQIGGKVCIISVQRWIRMNLPIQRWFPRCWNADVQIRIYFFFKTVFWLQKSTTCRQKWTLNTIWSIKTYKIAEDTILETPCKWSHHRVHTIPS